MRAQIPPVYEASNWEIDLTRRELRVGGKPVTIGGRAFEIVEVLAQSAGELVTKDQLMDRVWRGAIVEENTLQVHISAVRKALGADRDLLKTASGRGYRLFGNWTVREASAAATASWPEPEAALVPPLRNNLPAIVPELVGRNEAVQRVRDLLSGYRSVTLTGPAGIGKTALALEVARGEPGERWLVELASISDPGLVPSSLASTLGLTMVGSEIAGETVARAIGDRTLLLVLDNCEHVVESAAEAVDSILRLCPHTTVLATSREVLRIEGEHVYRVLPLEVPPPGQDEPARLASHSAVQLFLARTAAMATDFSGDPASLSLIASICRRLDGIPLAIEFAAARATTLGLPQVAALLDDRFQLLTGGRRTALPRHQTLRAALDWSYELLPPGEAALLRRLAVFAGDFSLEAAVAVAGDVPAPRVIDGIASLAAKSLVAAEFGDGIARYRLLETIRLYALEHARATDDIKEAAHRHAQYYRDLFLPAEADSETRPQAEWIAVYGPHLDNVRAALDWAFSPAGEPQMGIELTAAVVPLWITLSLLGECRERVERALVHLGDGSVEAARLRMQLSAALAWSLMYGVGRAREAGPAWQTTLEHAETLDDRVYRLRALWGLCIDQFNNGEFRQALAYARRFAALVENSTDAIDLMMGDRILATALHYLGDQTKARHHIDRALALLAPLAQQPQVVRLRFDMRVSTHYFQARILWLQGMADQALRVVERNIQEGRTLGHALTFCSVLGQAACPITYLAGDFDAAARYGALLREHTARHPVRLWQVWARCFMALVALRRGDANGLTELRAELEKAGDARFLPRFLLLIGEFGACLGNTGELAEGLAVTDEAIARCKARDEGWYLPELMRVKGELLRQQGAELAPAEDCFRQGLDIARQQGALFWELRSAISLARAHLRQDRRSEAARVLQRVYDRFSEGFEISDLCAAREMLRSLQPSG